MTRGGFSCVSYLLTYVWRLYLGNCDLCGRNSSEVLWSDTSRQSRVNFDKWQQRLPCRPGYLRYCIKLDHLLPLKRYRVSRTLPIVDALLYRCKLVYKNSEHDVGWAIRGCVNPSMVTQLSFHCFAGRRISFSKWYLPLLGLPMVLKGLILNV